MKPNYFRFLAVSIIGLMLSVTMFAQDRREITSISSVYVISAKAGAVNYVSGEVFNLEKDAKKVALQKGSNIEDGDLVFTETNGRAEILLNPGSYVRLAGNSEFQFVTTSLENDLELKLNRGSAIFEVIADKEFKIVINTPKSRFYLIQSGIYRVDALENGAGKISVWKGKAQVGDAKATTVKGGRTGTFENMQTVVAKFDKKNQGEFELWSKDRAQQIAKVNERLQRREMNRALTNSFNNNSWNASSGYGLWVRDPFSNSFCFLPFGYGWRSPYGFGYNQSIWNYNPPPQVINNIYQNPVVSNPNNNSNNNSTVNLPNNNNNFPSINGGGGGSIPSNNPTTREDRPVRESSPMIDRPARTGRPIDN